MSWIVFIWITYNFKSSTSKRKNNITFAKKIWKVFIKTMQGVYKMWHVSTGYHLCDKNNNKKPSSKLRNKLVELLYLHAYYNLRKQIVLQTDTSIKGLGACLLQGEKSVYFAGKALTEAQKGYIVIEIESLAVAWAMENFHHFLYASHFILETDQKPLEAISFKTLNQATPRLQRILIRTFLYHFTVHHIAGVTNQLANCLSRLGGQKDTIKLPKLHVYQITCQLSARSDSLNELRVSTQADGLAFLKHTICKDGQA